MPELTEISVKPIFEPRDINIDVKVKLLEGEDEIPINKKGDGTKRRITMALLEYKKVQQEKVPSLYVFDEPDTHLHVKAQMELLSILRQFCENGKQIIITTHSPFIMNFVKPRQIRLLYLENGETKIKYISSDKQLERVLMNLGIENIYLFFSRKILIVEGETEERFITIIYERLFGNKLHSNLIRVIKRDSITDVPRFAKVLCQFVKPEDILILVDSDIDERTDETKEIISKLEIPEKNIFKVGTKEFEDAFEAEVLYNA